jgi:hypothetical protein
MNERLQKTYYIIGIIQRVTMILLTIGMIGAAYKIYDLSIRSYNMLTIYEKEIKEIHQTVDNLYYILHKSWIFKGIK